MKKTVLVVDDMEINRDILTEMLEDTYNVITAADGMEAITILNDESFDVSLIMLDLVMPNMDGFAVLESLKATNILNRVPVIVITGSDSVENEKHCYNYGTVEFLRKPFDEALVKLRVGNVLDLFTYKNGLEDKVSAQTEKLRKQYVKLKDQATQLTKSNERIIDVLGTVVESRNLESGRHIQRVKDYTKILATKLMEIYPEYGITKHTIEVMVPASALHDVGKIAIPDNVLLKPGKLSPDEYESMKSHTTKGCELLTNIQGAWDKEYADMSYDICRYHHERYDGAGYPDGLIGDEIPIAAQIVSMADVYDALVNKRVYKDAYSCNKAYEMIVSGECGVFSPKLIDCLAKTRELFEVEASITD